MTTDFKDIISVLRGSCWLIRVKLGISVLSGESIAVTVVRSGGGSWKGKVYDRVI
jgi:hypothetical protein